MSERKKSSEKPKKSALAEHRQEQWFIAVHRDGGLCAFHYFLHNQEVPFQDVHHVYGRARRAGDPRESYENLLCTCRECHPLPIQHPGACTALEYVEVVLTLANKTPINKEFISPDCEEEKDNE